MDDLNRRSTSRSLSQWSPLVAFLILAIGISVAIQQSAQSDAERLREGLVQSCERVNKLRAESNRRIEAHDIERNVVLELIQTGKEAVEGSPSTATRQTVEAFDRLSNRMEQIRFDEVEIVPCEDIVPRP